MYYRFTCNISLFKTSMKFLVAMTYLFWGAISAFSQDFHYSQFHNSQMHLNPALTGVFGGDIRVAANYRNQWKSVPVEYRTFTVAADKKFIQRTDKKGYLAAGLAINYDQAGLSKLRLMDLGLSVSYTGMITDHFFATIGGQGRIGQRSFDVAQLSFDGQFDELRGVYDPSLPINENFANSGFFFPDVALGVNFRWQKIDPWVLVDRLVKRTKVDFGVGVFNLLQPNQSFNDASKVVLPIRISPYILSTWKIAQSVDLVLNGTAQWQNTYTQYEGLGGIKLHLDRKLGRQFAIQLDIGYRFNDVFGDALIPGIEIFYNGWQAGFTYDVNLSDFRVATDKRGGPELSLRYIIRRVRPLPKFKICPLI